MNNAKINDITVLEVNDNIALIQGDDVIVFSRAEITELKTFLEFVDF